MNKVHSYVYSNFTNKRRPTSGMFSSSELHIPYRPSTAHALHSFCIQQRRHRHFKSGKATANKCTWGTIGNVQRTNLAEKTCTQCVSLSKQSFRKRERQGLAGSLCNRPTYRARLRSRTTASMEWAISLAAACRICMCI